MASTNVRKQSKGIIFHVYNYLKDLMISKPEATVRELFSQTQRTTAEACGVSRSTVQRICAEADRCDIAGSSFESPKKNLPRVKRVTELDDFNKSVVRRTIQEFYDRGEYPTCSKIRDILMQKIDFHGSVKSMWIILKSLGFTYKMCNDGRKFLMERNDIVAARTTFLRKMHNIRNEQSPRPIIYLDETWVNQNHSRKYIWQNSTSKGGLKVPVGKGSRLIICHAGSSKLGFIEGAQLVFQSKKITDYHQEMNSEVFKEWFTDLLKGLEEPSVIVMDNASYHSTYKEKIPSLKTRKAEILSWLQSKNIAHNPNVTVPELLVIVKQHREKYRIYELDALAAEMGHEVVRLPPYHCQYNPIELIWAQVKGEIASKNTTFKINDVRSLLEEALNNVTITNWENSVRHSEKLQEDDFIKEGVRDDVVQPFLINLRDSDSSYSESEDED